MRTRFVLALVTGLLAVVFLLLPSIGGADPNLTTVPKHAHWLVTGSGESTVYVSKIGPDLCANPNLQNAFNQFHNNLHVATPSSIGPAAPGLHNDEGTSIVSRACSFVPPGG